MNAIDLKNRTAIVTGGARGIGFAIAKRMLASGATVVLWDVDAAALDKAGAALQREANGNGRVHAAVVDVTNDAAIARAVAADLRERGKIDILVNNAGIAGANKSVWDTDFEEWRKAARAPRRRAGRPSSDIQRRRPCGCRHAAAQIVGCKR